MPPTLARAAGLVAPAICSSDGPAAKDGAPQAAPQPGAAPASGEGVALAEGAVLPEPTAREIASNFRFGGAAASGAGGVTCSAGVLSGSRCCLGSAQTAVKPTQMAVMSSQ
eukprot:5693829-Prymnesium_polylepis.1